ncbi:MAG: hypothetical protein ACRD5I_13615 [Candidatus Acidiferrales bacterium]
MSWTNMECKEFHQLNESVLEGEADPRAYEHLAACPRCQALVDDLVAVTRAAHSLPVYEPSPRLWAQIQAAAIEEGLWSPAGAWRWRDWFGPAALFLPARPAFAAALALVLVFGAALGSWNMLESPEPLVLTGRIEEVAGAELVTEPGYGQRYQVHLQQVEKRVLEAEPADAEMVGLATGPLNDLDTAINNTQTRVEQYPEDSLAREELNRLYQQKATVLQAINVPAW